MTPIVWPRGQLFNSFDNPLKYTNPKLCSMRMHNCTFDNPWQPLMYKDCNLWSMRMQIWQALTTLKVQRLQALEYENVTIILPPRPLVYVTRGLLIDSFLPFCLFEHWERLILKDKYVHTFPSLFCLFSCPGSSIPDLGHWVTHWPPL